MRKQDLITLFEYNSWARDKILTSAANLSYEQLSAEGSQSYGSIIGCLSHIFNAEAMWLKRCQDGVSPAAVRFPEPPESLDELMAAWQAEQPKFMAYLQTLDNEQLDRPVVYKGFSGREFENTLWHILMQLVNHGVAHRAELVGKLTELGHSPGDLDFLIYLRR